LCARPKRFAFTRPCGGVAEELLLLVAGVGVSLAAAGWLAHRLGLPPALGYLAVGMVFAPAVDLTPNLPSGAIDSAAHVAVLFVLFFIGLELDLRTLRKVMKETAWVSLFNILVPAAAVLAIGQLLGWGGRQALILGLAVSLSSTIFGERLASLPGFPRLGRQRNFGILIGEDVAAGAILGLMAVLGTAESGLSFALPVARLLFFLVLATAAALLVVPKIMDAVARTHIPELIAISGLVLVVGFGMLGQVIGSAELGAFLAGMAAAEAGSRFVLRNTMAPLRDLGLALFFLAAGLHVDARAVVAHAGPILAISGAFLVTKILVHVPASLGVGMDLKDSLRTALGLSSIGEFSLILAAAAAGHGLAHPMLNTYIVGTMLVLLFVAPLLLNTTPWIVGRLGRLPRRITRPLAWVVQALARKRPDHKSDHRRQQAAVRVLLANLILLIGWVLLAVFVGPRLGAALPLPPRMAGAAVVGLSIALGAPLLYFTYRAYRDVVRGIVGLDSDSASRVRARLVDAWVALTGLLMLLPITLVVPATLPVLAGGALVALAILVVAWRVLTRFHSALEGSVTRVLGHDANSDALLDEVLRKYPWGVRFTAVRVPEDSPVANSTIQESRIMELTGARVAVLQRAGREQVNPSSQERFLPGDTVVLMGEEEAIDKAEALLVAHGEAIRASVRSRLAQIVEVPVALASLLVGMTLGAADIRGRTGALLAGLWPHGADHPEPFRPDLVIQESDQLIVLGSPLQVERARRLAAGESEITGE
jgi:monovalent cation:H+ antiporter-2, CPA2 family